ncbi:MAG: DUF4012 domain-containing protein, partial [Actinomycetota bacterium]|nr:DUF4012 domain-containing protein [Actinomycetota bacterium]
DRPLQHGVIAAAAVVLALAATFLWLYMLAGPWRLASGLIETKDHLHRAQAGIKAGRKKDARFETLSAVAAADRARSGYGSHSPLFDIAQLVPVVRDAWSQVGHLVDAAHYSASAAKGTLDVTQSALHGPHKIITHDPSGPKGSKKIDIGRVTALGHTIASVHADVARVQRDLEQVDLHKLPHRLWKDVRHGIRQAHDTTVLLSKVQAGFKLLPDFLGANGPRRYLLAMQNSGELRGTGGSILQFGQLSIDHGSPHLENPKTVYKIDKQRRQISIPLPRAAWYVRQIPDAQRFGNSNWSPDWPLSAQLMLRYARATDPRFPPVNGVIAVDPTTMQQLVGGTGAFRAGKLKHHGKRITRKHVLSFLLYKAYATYPDPGIRRAVLGKLVAGFYQALLKPKHPTGLLQGMGRALSEKHMQIWMADPSEEAFVKKLGWDGSLDQSKHGDYLNVVEQNVGGNKLDYFEQQQDGLSVKIAGRSAIDTARVTITNPVFVPQPHYWLGDSGPYDRAMMNVYVPGHARLVRWATDPLCPVLITKKNITQASAPRPCRLDAPAPAIWSTRPAEHLELGKKVWSATLQIPARQQGSLSYTYKVPGAVITRGNRSIYRVVLQHQPKVHAETVSVRLALPPGVSHVQAPGFAPSGDTLVWQRKLTRDTVLEVSWRP